MKRRKCRIVYWSMFAVTLMLMYVVVLHISTQPSDDQDVHEVTDELKALRRDFVLNDGGGEEVGKPNLQLNKKNTIRFFNYETARKEHSTEMVQLKTLIGKTPIFIHPPNVDQMISSYVKDYGTWEEDLLNQTAMLVQRYENLVFLDIGSNIGVYSLFIASLGVEVIAVEPVVANLVLLYKSVKAGRFRKNVTLVNNAVSDKYEQLFMDIPEGNIGGAHFAVNDNQDQKAHSSSINTIDNCIETIMLDDLIPMVGNKKVVVKMDIEGHELNALQGARTFFQSVDVRAVLMEWSHHRYSDNGRIIATLMVNEGFLPYPQVSILTVLNPDRYHSWPENVFWVKK
ncbi:uncharacterized protein LOC128212956 [Mya arenaria]|uniref:uncharacterized protein LOC128212956 n=1 Tax=Mya arenaria TaxID=6604 RepID=UPI0022E62813|nr:uncharacterized protein LOC128212956 [Mya arenaria]